ncbi:hypothetical protein NQ317_007672 [Molorchus minor]|uniref:NACHT domain-containing protein n=1 Tax=Molorchus minor TaxID=1323400 RepID=A0ABQ9J2E3_9CUCU|nr:hypothetical protein NQ317_007672 [Molorchus minor]
MEIRKQPIISFTFLRVPSKHNKDTQFADPETLPISLAKTNCKTTFQNQLTEKHIVRIPVRFVEGGLNMDILEHEQYIAQVTVHLKKHLTEMIDTIIEEHNSKTMLKPSYGIETSLFEELNQQTGFCQKAAQCSINREKMINQIKSYITDDNTCPLIIYGPSGCGKTTLLARIAQCCQQWLPDSFLVIRFAGISAQSSTIEQLLSSITNQCSILSYGHKCYCTHSIDTYAEILPNLLTASCIQRPLIILLDGLDQVRAYSSKNIDWLPMKLPDNIKLIISVSEDSDMHTDMPLLGEDEAKGILMSSVIQYNHSVLAWQTSWWVDKEHNVVPKGHVNNQITLMLEELETIIGIAQVQHSLALLTCTKHGITDSEIIDLLAFDENFHSSSTYVLWAPACLAWSSLYKHLAPFLQWSLTGGVLGIQWKDKMLKEAIADRYRDHKKWANQMLYDYYSGKWWKSKPVDLQARLVTQENILGKWYGLCANA